MGREAWCKILCKRNSTKSRRGAMKSAQAAGWIPWPPGVPACGAVCTPQVWMPARLPGHAATRDQPAARPENMISSWLSTRSQFWHLVRQRFVIRWEAIRHTFQNNHCLAVVETFFQFEIVKSPFHGILKSRKAKRWNNWDFKRSA